MNTSDNHLDQLQSRLDREPSAPLSDEELDRLRTDIELAAQWDDLERMEDALRPTDAPEGLHDRIVARIAAEPILAPRAAPSHRRGIMQFALAAAAVLAVALASSRYEEEQSRRREGAAILASLPMPSLSIPDAQLPDSPFSNLGADTEPIRAFAALGMNTAASPLRTPPPANEE